MFQKSETKTFSYEPDVVNAIMNGSIPRSRSCEEVRSHVKTTEKQQSSGSSESHAIPDRAGNVHHNNSPVVATATATVLANEHALDDEEETGSLLAQQSGLHQVVSSGYVNNKCVWIIHGCNYVCFKNKQNSTFSWQSLFKMLCCYVNIQYAPRTEIHNNIECVNHCQVPLQLSNVYIHTSVQILCLQHKSQFVQTLLVVMSQVSTFTEKCTHPRPINYNTFVKRN